MSRSYAIVCRTPAVVELIRERLREHPDLDPAREIPVRTGCPDELHAVLLDGEIQKILLSRSELLWDYVQEHAAPVGASPVHVNSREFLDWARAEDRFERDVRHALRGQEYLEVQCTDVDTQLTRVHGFLGVRSLARPVESHMAAAPQLGAQIENYGELAEALRGTVFGLELARGA